MDELTIEPMGGFVGAGGAGHVKSAGRLAISALSPEDRARVENLFSRPSTAPGNFYYRITRRTAAGTTSVNAPPEAVPAALVASVQTTLE